MRRLILLSFLLISSQLFSQFIYSDTTWERWYGKQNYQEGSASSKHDIEHYDKGYIFYGRNELGNPDKPIIKKTDINGYFLWERKLDSLSDKYILSMINSDDGGLLLCGGINDVGYSNPWVAKLNACMEVEWCKIFRWSEFSYAVDIKVDHEGNIIVLTDYYGYSPGENINLIKLSPQGEVLWKNNYATMEDYPYIWNAYARKLLISEDNHYFIAGEAEWPTNNDPQQGKGSRAFFIKVNPDGEEEWVLPFGIYDGLFGTSLNIFQLEDNKFLSIGKNVLNNNPILHYFNSNGEELNWYTNEFMPGVYYSSGLFSSKRISDISFFALWGYFYSPSEPFGHTGYMVFDTALNILDYKEDDRWQGPANLIHTYNNKLVTVATMREAEKTTYYDIYMNKRNIDFSYDTVYTNWSGAYDSLCEGGVVSGYLPYDCGVVVGINEIPSPEQYKEAQEKIGIQVQPNPAKTQARLILENTAKFKEISMSVYNQTGEEVFARKVRTGSLEEVIDISHWSRGIYFVVMRSEGRFKGSAKLLVE